MPSTFRLDRSLSPALPMNASRTYHSLMGKLRSFNQMPMSTSDDANLGQVPSPMGNDGMGWSVVLC